MQLPTDGATPGALKEIKPVVKKRGRPPKNSRQESSIDMSQSETKRDTLSELPTEVDDTRDSSLLEVSDRDTQPSASVHFETSPKVKLPTIDKEGVRISSGSVYSGDAYEFLGLHSVEPTSRPPILPKTPQSEALLTWAASDCARSSMLLRRARPLKSIQASFFDRLEGLRRVVLAEIAKAGSNQAAMAAVGVAFDRECLLLGAEESFSQSRAREAVLGTSPGNYIDLAMDIEHGAGFQRARGSARAIPRPASTSRCRFATSSTAWTRWRCGRCLRRSRRAPLPPPRT